MGDMWYDFTLFDRLERSIRTGRFNVKTTIKTVTIGNVTLTMARDTGSLTLIPYSIELVFRDSGRGLVIGRSHDRYEIDAVWQGATDTITAIQNEAHRQSIAALPAETVLAHFTHGTDKYTLIERGRNRERRVEVQSKSGEDYTIMRDDRGALSCTCKGFIFRRSCRHSLTVLACTQPGGVFEKFTNYKAS